MKTTCKYKDNMYSVEYTVSITDTVKVRLVNVVNLDTSREIYIDGIAKNEAFRAGLLNTIRVDVVNKFMKKIKEYY